LFHTGSAPGICPSELSPPGWYPDRFRPEEPTCRFAHPYTFAPESARAGLMSRGSWALTHPASPWRSGVWLAHRPLDAPVGLTLPRFPTKALTGISPDLLSRACPVRLTPDRRRPRVSISFRLASSAPASKPARVRVRHLLRVSAPGRSRTFESACFPGYVFTSRRAAHYCRLPTLFGKPANPTGVVRTDRRC